MIWDQAIDALGRSGKTGRAFKGEGGGVAIGLRMVSRLMNPLRAKICDEIFLKRANSNSVPQSVGIVEGSPNMATQRYTNALMTVLVVMSRIGKASCHRKNWSIHMNRNMQTLNSGRGPQYPYRRGQTSSWA